MKNNDVPICHMSCCVGNCFKYTSRIHPVESQMCFLPDWSMCYGTATATPTGCISKHVDLKTGCPSLLYLHVTWCSSTQSRC